MRNIIKRVSIIAVTAVASLAILAALDTSRADAAFGAIAYSESTGQYGYTYGYDCLDDANNDAVANANADDAQVMVNVENGWAALATGDNGTYGYGWSTNSQEEAENIALDGCGACNNPSILCWVASGT